MYGHDRWVERFKKELPEMLIDVSTSEMRKAEIEACENTKSIFYRKDVEEQYAQENRNN